MCLAPPVAAAAPPAGAARLLRSVARRYWPRLGLTYLLFAVENGLMLLQPLCLGRAIDGLVRGDRGGWWVLAAVYLAHAAVGAVRRVFDTRSFTAIYRDLAAAMVAAQRGRGVPVSRVATRSALSRSLVDFLEHDLPLAMHTFASLAGALVLLWWYDAALAAACTALVGPYWLLARWYRRRLAHHNRDLHDQMEREVDVIRENRPAAVADHYRRLARSWVRLSDWEAFNTAVAQLVLLGLVAGGLLHLCVARGASPGDVFAVLRYLILFVTGVDGLPLFLRQVTKFQDIAARVGREGGGDRPADPGEPS